MFGLHSASKAGLVCLSVFSLSLAAPAAFAQAPVISEPAEVTNATDTSIADTNITETNIIEADITEADVTEASLTADEAAMLDLLEALNTDGISVEAIAPIEPNAIQESAIAEESTVLEGSTEAAKPVDVEPVKQPGASVLSGLETASINNTAFAEPVVRDLSAVNVPLNVDPSSVPALRAALNSDSALTRLYAADALWTLTGDRDLVLPTLMSAAVKGDTQAQRLAIRAIAQLGEDALPAVPILNTLIGDRDSRTRQIAQDALAIVRSERRSSTVLGIIVRESRRRLIPAAFRAITNLW